MDIKGAIIRLWRKHTCGSIMVPLLAVGGWVYGLAALDAYIGIPDKTVTVVLLMACFFLEWQKERWKRGILEAKLEKVEEYD